MIPELYTQFLAEASSHLEAIEEWLTGLAGSGPPHDATEVLRSAHSLKGAARLVGAAAVATLAGEMEARIADLARATAPDRKAIEEVRALCDQAMKVLERGEEGGAEGEERAYGPPREEAAAMEADEDRSLWGQVRKALPTLSELLVESLTEFQCHEVLRLLGEDFRFWLVHVATTTETFESGADRAAAYLRERGHVVSQTAGVSDQPGFDYVATFLFAGKDAPPAPEDASFPLRNEELALGQLPTPEAHRAPPAPATEETLEAPQGQKPARAGEEEVDAQLQEIFLTTADNLVQELTDSIAAAERSPDSTDALDALFRAGHSLKGAGGSFGFPIVSRLGFEMEQVLDRVRRRQLAFTQDLLDVLYECVDALTDIVNRAREGALDQNAPLRVVESLRRVARGEAPAEPAPTGVVVSALGHTMHLSVEAADRLLDLGRDAWIAAETASFVAAPDGEIREAIDRTRLAILSVVNAILATRMQPVGQVLRAFPRLVRDVCRQYGKQVRLDVVGADVQMDRLLLEAINDPLVHLVRNALDHGIETAQERQQMGKPPEGLLSIHVSADRGAVTIEIKDDGRGVNIAALRRKAVETGRLSPEAADGLTEAQALDLIFLPGITTREAVTELSGRGVGMDVVRSKIEQVRGRVEVSTERGKGTSVRLRLPLTTAILRVVEVRVAGLSLCLPTTAVERVVSAKPGQREIELPAPSGTPEVIPLVLATRYLPRARDAGEAHEAVILRDRGQVLGLLVERVEDERPVLVTDLGGLISRTKWVGACTLLANGQVAPILDTSAILAAFNARDVEHLEAEAKPKPSAERPPGPPTILSIDDSPTMRQLMRNVLELAGYRVLLAADGKSALDILSHTTPDLVLADLNLPGTDGFSLVREIRRRWADVPVAIVSGRDQEADREAGFKAGASAYIVKGAADRRGMLATVARLLSEDSRK